MSDETRPAEEIRADIGTIALGLGIHGRLLETEAAHRLLADVEPLLVRAERAERVERECAELGEEQDRLRELNGRQARYIEELQKPVQEHCRTWHIPALAERDEARRQLADAQAQLAEAREEIANLTEFGVAVYEQVEARAEQAEATIAAMVARAGDEATFDDVYTEISLALGTDDSADEDVDFKRDLTARIVRHFAAALAAAGPSTPETPSGRTLTHEQIQSYNRCDRGGLSEHADRIKDGTCTASDDEPSPKAWRADGGHLIESRFLMTDEIGGDECGDLLPGDENLPLAGNLDPEPLDPGPYAPASSDAPARWDAEQRTREDIDMARWATGEQR